MASFKSINAPASSSSSIQFYDLATSPPALPSAPNPCKARYALNYKRVPYITTWIPLTHIASVRKSTGTTAVRQFADGTDYHTIPFLVDGETVVGDSFDIARYAQTYAPATSGAEPGPSLTSTTSFIPDLFPALALDYTSPYLDDSQYFAPLSVRSGEETAVLDVYANFNRHVDATFSAFVILAVDGIPFETETANEVRTEFVRRAGVPSWDALVVTGEARRTMLAGFEKGLEGLAQMYIASSKSGPFLMGDTVTYADMIVGGWLRMMSVTLPAEEWAEMQAWHGRVFGRLFDGLQPWGEAR